ncbi:PIN domain-containing protein [Leptospira meyeri]|uniref:PIN domain-containing protein n=1 Tax=Leptospira meyeri TaxID=29508 RepID=UPI000C2A7BFC|nr:PIN domain-containing protein [Leptospira meyeri]PJZ79183.1 pilus assembly protein [Leptospira meyeri]PJZ95054.1 pilus assembly protein [Leptospira meyeri]
MILVDTSVWIEFFRGKEPYFSKLVGLIEASDIIAHEVVFGELLQGCKSRTEVTFVLDYWESLNNILSNGTFIQAGKLSFENKHLENGIGIIDSILISETKQRNLKLWTLDKKILKVIPAQYIYEI